MNISNKKIFIPLAFISPLIAVLWRVIYRGYYYPGWEVIGPSAGLLVINELGIIGAIKSFFYITRHCDYCGLQGIIYSFIPGIFAMVFPWEYWSHTFNFIMFTLSFWLCGVSFQLKGKEWGYLALILGSSATLMTYSISGSHYVSGIVPHSLALLVLLHPYFKKHPIISFFLGLLAIEISWHGFPLGKTIFITFLLGAFLQNNTLKRRTILFILGCFSVALIYFNNVGRVENKLMSFDNLIGIENLLDIIKHAFSLDLITIPLLGLLSLPFLKKNRLFFAGILLSQWALVILLGFYGVIHLRARRFIMVDFYSVVLILAILKERLPQLNKTTINSFIAILILGNLYQFYNLYNFTRTDIQQQKFALPFTESKVDFHIRPVYEDAAQEIYNLVKKDKKIIMIYNSHVYAENNTNPEALPERLYLKLGHKKFTESIFIFYDKKIKYTKLLGMRSPTKPFSELNSFIDNINNIQDYVVLKHPEERGKFKTDTNIIMTALTTKFKLVEQEKIPPFIFYKIFPHDEHDGEFIKNDVQYGEFIKKWLIMGDIPGPTNPRQIFSEDFLVENGGEQKILPTEGMVHHYKDNITSKWIEYSSPTDLINFNKIFKNKENTVAYAFTTLHSPINQKVILALGSDDRPKVWLNGELVHQEFGRRWVEPDQDKIEVLLKKGQNTILLKVVQFHGQWGFTCRLLKNTDT